MTISLTPHLVPLIATSYVVAYAAGWWMRLLDEHRETRRGKQ